MPIELKPDYLLIDEKICRSFDQRWQPYSERWRRKQQAVLLPTALLKSVLACTTHTKALGFAYKTFFRAFMGFANIQLPIANAREVFR